MNELDPISYNSKILEAMDDLIENGPWSKTLFLSVVGKKLDGIRDRFRNALGLDEVQESKTKSDLLASTLASRVAERTGQLEVFVSLYNVKGIDLYRWESILHNMGKQIISRPIFQTEDHVRELIRSKINKVNEAYIAVYINKNDLIKPTGGAVPVDPLGHPLLVLKEGAVKMENITRFMHSSGRYQLRDGRLIRQGDAEYLDFM